MLTLKDQIILTPAGQWVYRHKILLSGALLALLVLIGWQAFSLMPPSDVKDRRIDEMFAAWKKHPEDEALFSDLRSAAKKISGPHSIQPQIAQILLALGRSDEAEELSRVSVGRLRMIAPAYAEFAEVSLLISRKKYQEALERSVSLKEALDEKESVLYGKNLVRIAFLQEQLENRAGETAAWRELEELLKSRDKGPLVQGLGHRESDFQAYFDERRKL